MSDTPETDHLEVQLGQAATHSHPILWEHSRKMERERDDALSQIAQAEKRAERFCQDRDEAREQLRIAVGLLSMQPQFADKHPEEVLAFVKEGAK